MATLPTTPAHPVTPPRPQLTTSTAPPTAPAATPPTPTPQLSPNLDRRVLKAAETFGVVLRNGQTWRVKLIEMDTWTLLVETDQGRVLLPKHAVDAYLLDPA